MNELQKLIEKWDEQIALHRRVCEEPLMYTKEERLKNSHYAQAICAVIADVKKLTIPDVSNRRELLCAFFKYFRDNGEANIGMTIEQFVDSFLSTQ